MLLSNLQKHKKFGAILTGLILFLSGLVLLGVMNVHAVPNTFPTGGVKSTSGSGQDKNMVVGNGRDPIGVSGGEDDGEMSVESKGGNVTQPGAFTPSTGSGPITGVTGKDQQTTPVPSGEIKDFTGLIKFASGMLNVLIVLCVGAATVLFMKGLLMYVHHGGDDDKVSEARNYIILGIIVLTAMISVYGLVAFLTNTFFGSTSNQSNFLSSPGL